MATNDAALERIRRLEEQLARKKAELVRARGRVSERERKARFQKVVKLGELAELAGLLDADPALVLGALLEAAEVSPGSNRFEALRARGEGALPAPQPGRRKREKTEA